MKLSLNIEKKHILPLILIFLPIFYGYYLCFCNETYLGSVYTVEDGPIEWLTVVALMSSCILWIVRVVKLRKKKSLLFLALMLGVAAVFFFGAGEEISWGQRLFGIEPSEFFKHNNSQREMNIHNLVLGGKKINKIIFGTFLGICVSFYLLILPVLYRYSSKIKNYISKLAIPVPRNIFILSQIFLFALISTCPSPKKGELLEYGTTWIFFLICLWPLNDDLYKSD